MLDLLMHLSQRSYYFSGLVFTYADTKARLHERAQQIISAAQAEGIELETYTLRQQEGLNSVLSLGHNHCDIYRDLMMRELSILVPFTTLGLNMEGGGYYDQNALSGNLIICNREALMSPHGFVCGMSGSGKGPSLSYGGAKGGRNASIVTIVSEGSRGLPRVLDGQRSYIQRMLFPLPGASSAGERRATRLGG